MLDSCSSDVSSWSDSCLNSVMTGTRGVAYAPMPGMENCRSFGKRPAGGLLIYVFCDSMMLLMSSSFSSIVLASCFLASFCSAIIFCLSYSIAAFDSSFDSFRPFSVEVCIVWIWAFNICMFVVYELVKNSMSSSRRIIFSCSSIKSSVYSSYSSSQRSDCSWNSFLPSAMKSRTSVLSLRYSSDSCVFRTVFTLCTILVSLTIYMPALPALPLIDGTSRESVDDSRGNFSFSKETCFTGASGSCSSMFID